MNQDREHLRILSILFYVMAGIIAAASSLLLIYVAIGIAMILLPAPNRAGAGTGLIMIIFCSVFLLVGLAFAGCNAAVGYCISRNKAYVFTLVIAGMICIFKPLGTALGIFTFIVLLRPSVREIYKQAALPHATLADDELEELAPQRDAEDTPTDRNSPHGLPYCPDIARPYRPRY